ncbi:unnamed protein product, partial [Musa acuminata var. zebrina]
FDGVGGGGRGGSHSEAYFPVTNCTRHLEDSRLELIPRRLRDVRSLKGRQASKIS